MKHFREADDEAAGMTCRFIIGRGSPLRRSSSRALSTMLAWLVLSAAVVGSLGAAPHPQGWPDPFVKVVVPYGPGGISDVLARITSDRLSTIFSQRFIVEAHPGANGAIGTEYAVRSPPDGYTLYEAGGAQFSVVPVMQKLSYDP